MKVIIFDEQFIPGLGKGPFTDPIEISEDKFNLYKRLGLKIIDVSKTAPIAESGVRNVQKTKKNNISSLNNEEISIVNKVSKTNFPVNDNTSISSKQVEKEEIVEESKSDIIEEPIEESIEDVKTEEILEEEEVEETVVEEKLDEEEIDLEALTKRELIELLNDNGFEVDPKLNKTKLIEKAEELLS